MNAKMSLKADKVLAGLREMANISHAGKTFLVQRAWPLYIEAQKERWNTLNRSEDGPEWPENNPRYATWKRKKFADYPGGGRGVMVASGGLVEAATGLRPEGLYRLITDTYMLLQISRDYFKAYQKETYGTEPKDGMAYPERLAKDEGYQFMTFGRQTRSNFRSEYKQFVNEAIKKAFKR